MHISEGVLSVPVLVAGAAAGAAGVAIGLRKLDYERVPRVAVLASAFFVASLIHVPIGPSNVHLVLNGLVGLVLGWAAFPAILIALLLQAVLFGFGGLTSLGVNLVIMAVPALLCHLALSRWLRSARGPVVFLLGAGAGVLGIVGGCVLLAGALLTTGQAFARVAQLALVAHGPVAIIEGAVTGAVVVFLRQVRPELLQAPTDPLSEKGTVHA